MLKISLSRISSAALTPSAKPIRVSGAVAIPWIARSLLIKSSAIACGSGSVKQSFYRWRKEYGGLEVDQAKRMKELERENIRLERRVADLSLEKQVVKDVASETCKPRTALAGRRRAFGPRFVRTAGLPDAAAWNAAVYSRCPS
jgi:hypothetical protein